MFEHASVQAGFFEGKKKKKRLPHPALEIGRDEFHQVLRELRIVDL
jgi:hypothetical protein